MTVDNPSPIVDRQTGAIHFLYQVNYAQLYYMRSDDNGLTFSTPDDITETVHAFRHGAVNGKSESQYG
jgi:sialidase-1